MKKTILFFAVIAVASCGNEKEEAKELTYEDRVKLVCDCFSKGDDVSKCFMLQSAQQKELPEEEKVKFLQETNNCAN